jgi:ATP-dependent RNA helicase DeaD
MLSIIHFPSIRKNYVHRIGRTGRAGNDGTAITFITPAEFRKLNFIKGKAGADIRRETVPKVEEVIANKQKKIKAELEDILKFSDDLGYYNDLAKEFFADHNSEEALAALLKHAFQHVLHESSYRQIEDIPKRGSKNYVDHGGKTRLFITIGKKDRLGPAQLVSLIEEHTGVPSRRIDDVYMQDKFSFVTVSFEDGEHILKLFKTKMKNRNIVVSKAEGGGKSKPAGKPRGRGPSRSKKRRS